MKKLNFNKPMGWRNGQFLFNWLAWLAQKGYPVDQSNRIADTFHIDNKTLDELYKTFVLEEGGEKSPQKTTKKSR